MITCEIFFGFDCFLYYLLKFVLYFYLSYILDSHLNLIPPFYRTQRLDKVQKVLLEAIHSLEQDDAVLDGMEKDLTVCHSTSHNHLLSLTLSLGRMCKVSLVNGALTASQLSSLGPRLPGTSPLPRVMKSAFAGSVPEFPRQQGGSVLFTVPRHWDFFCRVLADHNYTTNVFMIKLTRWQCKLNPQ